MSSPQPAIVELPRPRPLRNPTNYCFINAPVMATFGVPAFRHALRELWSSTPGPLRTLLWDIMCSERSDRSRPRETAPGSCSNERRLAAIFRYALQGQPGVPFDARLLLDRLYHGNQEDAEEFVRQGLLGALDASHPIADNMVMGALCMGRQQWSTRCAACGLEMLSGRPEVFNTLQLSVLRPDGRTCVRSVQEALAAHLEPSLVQDPDYRFECDSCASHALPWRFCKITHSPSVLVLQFKRWLPSDLNAPLTAVLPPADHVDLQGTRYRLASFVCHVGASIQHGHYTACIRYPTSDVEWWLYNDAVTRAATPAELHTSEASKLYLAFYERLDVP